MKNQKNEEKEMEKAPEASLTNQPGAPIPKAVDLMQSAKDYGPYLGPDSTAINEILITRAENEQGERENEEVSAWLQSSSESKTEADAEIKTGVELARVLSAGYNRVINLTGKNLAERAISLGKVLFRLKHLAKDSGILWGVWAEKNLPFISKRSREKFMLLAKRKDCHRYSFLGVDRLEMLCSSTKESEDSDPIENLLSKYQITHDEGSETNLAEFKILIDSALNNEKLIKSGLQVPSHLVQDLTRIGVNFDKSFLKKLKDIQDCSGNPNALLEKLSMNRGAEDPEPEVGKRLQDFNTLSNRLIKTIDYLIEEEDQLPKIDRETLVKLWSKLQRLQSAANLAVTEQAA